MGAMGDRSGPELPPVRAKRLWRLMQRIEYCRYRAELAAELAERCPGDDRMELLEIVQHWRDLAREIELIDGLSGDPAMAGAQPRNSEEGLS
jgi:hypothetical protein